MAKKSGSTFDTIFPLIRDAIRKIGASGEWVEHDSIVNEIKANQRIKDFHLKYLNRDSAPKKYLQIEDWVGNQLDFFSKWYTEESDESIGKLRGMQNYISEFGRREKNKSNEKWAYKVKFMSNK